MHARTSPNLENYLIRMSGLILINGFQVLIQIHFHWGLYITFVEVIHYIGFGFVLHVC